MVTLYKIRIMRSKDKEKYKTMLKNMKFYIKEIKRCQIL